MKPFYTHREELWNSWSHAAGILLGMAFGMVFLYWCFRVKDGWATFGVSLYLLGMVGSYVASTCYHALRPISPWKERLRKWECRHLLAYRGQLFPHHAGGAPWRRALGVAALCLRMDVCHRWHDQFATQVEAS